MKKDAVTHTRRSALRLSGSAALGLSVAGSIDPTDLFAADAVELPPLNRFPRMVHNY